MGSYACCHLPVHCFMAPGARSGFGIGAKDRDRSQRRKGARDRGLGWLELRAYKIGLRGLGSIHGKPPADVVSGIIGRDVHAGTIESNLNK